MRPFNKLMTAFLLIGGCGGDRFETVPFPDPDANPDDSGKSDHGNDGFEPMRTSTRPKTRTTTSNKTLRGTRKTRARRTL